MNQFAIRAENCPDATLYHSEDWRIVLTDIRDAANVPLDLSGAELRLQFRNFRLPNQIVADLALGSGLTLTPGSNGDGPTVTIISSASHRTFTPNEDTYLIGDLMFYRGSIFSRTSTLIRRLHLNILVGATYG